jgi:hypothetical protein
MADNTWWLNRDTLKKLGFREMEDNDRQGYAGAGPDCLILERGECISLADLSWDPNSQGFEWNFWDDDSNDQVMFSASVEDIAELEESGFKMVYDALGAVSAARVNQVVEKLGYQQTRLDSHQLRELVDSLKVKRTKTHVVADESIATRLRQAATS